MPTRSPCDFCTWQHRSFLPLKPFLLSVFPTQPIHLDKAYYNNPAHYNAFRFPRPFEEVPDAGRPEEGRMLATTITGSFFAFGYGKHACPGRFFVSQTLKQAIAQLVLSYDVEMVHTPSRWAMGNAMIPPTAARIRVRRRAKE